MSNTIQKTSNFVQGSRNDRIDIIEDSIDSTNASFYLILGSLVWHMNKLMSFFFYVIFLVKFILNIKNRSTNDTENDECNPSINKIRIYGLIAGLIIIILSILLSSFTKIKSATNGFRIIVFIMLFVFKNTILKKLTIIISQIVINSLCNPKNILCSLSEKSHITTNYNHQVLTINNNSGLINLFGLPKKINGVFTGFVLGEFLTIVFFLLCYILLNYNAASITNRYSLIYKLLSYIKTELNWFDFNTIFYKLKYFDLLKVNAVELIIKIILLLVYANIVPHYYNNYIEKTSSNTSTNTSTNTNKIFRFWSSESYNIDAYLKSIISVIPVLMLLKNNYDPPSLQSLPEPCSYFEICNRIFQYFKNDINNVFTKFLAGILIIVPFIFIGISEGLSFFMCKLLHALHSIIEYFVNIKNISMTNIGHILNIVIFLVLYIIIRQILISRNSFNNSTYLCIPDTTKCDEIENENDCNNELNCEYSLDQCKDIKKNLKQFDEDDKTLSYVMGGIISIIIIYLVVKTVPSQLLNINRVIIFGLFAISSIVITVTKNNIVSETIINQINLDNNNNFYIINSMSNFIYMYVLFFALFKIINPDKGPRTSKITNSILLHFYNNWIIYLPLVLITIFLTVLFVVYDKNLSDVQKMANKQINKASDEIDDVKNVIIENEKKIVIGNISILSLLLVTVICILIFKRKNIKNLKILILSTIVLSGYLGYYVYLYIELNKNNQISIDNKLILQSIIFSLITISFIILNKQSKLSNIKQIQYTPVTTDASLLQGVTDIPFTTDAPVTINSNTFLLRVLPYIISLYIVFIIGFGITTVENELEDLLISKLSNLQTICYIILGLGTLLTIFTLYTNITKKKWIQLLISLIIIGIHVYLISKNGENANKNDHRMKLKKILGSLIVVVINLIFFYSSNYSNNYLIENKDITSENIKWDEDSHLSNNQVYKNLLESLEKLRNKSIQEMKISSINSKESVIKYTENYTENYTKILKHLNNICINTRNKNEFKYCKTLSRWIKKYLEDNDTNYIKKKIKSLSIKSDEFKLDHEKMLQFVGIITDKLKNIKSNDTPQLKIKQSPTPI
jgi:hypothetical protein